MKNIVIFASGNGTNAQCIAEHFKSREDVRIPLILCNKKDAYVFERARRLGIAANDVENDDGCYQLDLFTDFEAVEREKALQRAMLEVRRRFGMNAVVKGMNLLEGATTIERNGQIGGHRAG